MRPLHPHIDTELLDSQPVSELNQPAKTLCRRRAWDTREVAVQIPDFHRRSQRAGSTAALHPAWLFGLREEHAEARSARGVNCKPLLDRAMRNGHAVTVFVERGLAIDKQHVMVGAVALDVMEADVPRVQGAVTHQRHLLPMRKCSSDFNRGGLLRLPIGKTPAKDFRKDGFTFGSTLKRRTRFRNQRRAFVRRFAEGVAKKLRHILARIVTQNCENSSSG